MSPLTKRQQGLARSVVRNPDQSGAATRRLIIADLKAVLNAATEGRRERDEWVNGQPGWVLYERQQMHAAVNDWRAVLGLGPVAVEPIERADQHACGHSDYVATFAIGCADIALGKES